MQRTNDAFLQILSNFSMENRPIYVKPYGNGHINDTFKVTTDHSDIEYVLQRINHLIFKHIYVLQNNIDVVTSHIHKKLVARGEQNIDRKVLTFLSAKDEKSYYFDGTNYWRVCLMIPCSQSFDEVNVACSFEAGRAFGDFQSMLSDLPDWVLGDTIPNFHNMVFRLMQFREAITANPVSRLEEVKELVDELRSRTEAMCIHEVLYHEGKLEKRTIHCDTKVNNVLFEEEGKVLCIIDLDAVMPGFVLSDFGDFIRTGTNTGTEDDENIDRVNVDLDIFKAYTRGYMETAQSFLTPLEISMLPYGGRLLTYMQTVRFLTDYINGDTYYRIHHPKHNLIRTKAEFKLLQSLEAHAAEMDGFMEAYL